MAGRDTTELAYKGKYHNCPAPIFEKLSGLQNSGMERYSSPKFVAEILFTTLKISLKLNRKY